MSKALVFIIKLYQKYVSPSLPRHCNYYPTCSQYAVEALQKRGLFIGLALAVWRILRCNPWSLGGFDPVPEPGRAKALAQK